MELTELKAKIISSFTGDKKELDILLAEIEKDSAVFPFNEYELLIATLISNGGLSYDKYLEIRKEYICKNPNLWLFEISAPRDFGEKFMQSFVKSRCSKIETPSKKYDANYHGQYDFWLEGVRVEVKASRVVDKSSDEPLYKKALSFNTRCGFDMNFQQLKPQCCDVFVWVAVFRDVFITWVMSSNEVLRHADYSKGQHRGNNGNEGQLHITDNNIASFKKYILKNDNLALAIKRACKRNLI